MISSTSNSDVTEVLLWSRWLLLFVAAIVIGSASVLALVVAIDPFSTGRLTPIGQIDYVTDNRIYADIARVRDPRFDAAILGDSHAVRVIPDQLDRATGRRFAMLAIEGTWPDQHLYLLHQFRERHGEPVMVVMLDDLWCSAQLGSSGGYIVPRWLYDGSTLQYLSHILSPYSLRMSVRRVRILLGLDEGEAADGYDPKPWMPLDREQMARDLVTFSPPTEGPSASAPFPFLDELERTMHELDPRTTVLLVFSPVYVKHLPVPGSKADDRLTACKARAAAIAGDAPHASLLDLYTELPGTEDRANFVDATHWTSALAPEVDAAIAQRLNALLN